jgi:hypothetical protein
MHLSFFYSLVGETEVSFAEIAPDLQMVYFTGKKTTWDALKVTRDLGEGMIDTFSLLRSRLFSSLLFFFPSSVFTLFMFGDDIRSFLKL